MKRRRSFFLTHLGLAALLLSTGVAAAQDYSRARAVRLSFVEGTVTVQRPEVAEWAEAPANTPLQEGFRLSTGDGSFAEVEFENCGTARLGQSGLLGFTGLGLTSGGGKINHLQLEQGYATFHARLDGSDDSFEVTTPALTVTARGNAMFRVDLDQDVERVEVFRGAVDVTGSSGTWGLEKNMVLELNPDSGNPADLTEGIVRDDWDNWVERRESQLAAAQAAPPQNGSDNSPGAPLYGWNDLGQYGTWSYISGWGYGWFPSSMGSGWAPYSAGQWCWYPGWGWTWIAAEPWGWVPYHYGGWNFVAGIGWAWFPEGFGTWSPAPVTWYSGSGWVGWTPRLHPIHGGITASCMGGQNCGGAAVSLKTFSNGGTVSPKTVVGHNFAMGVQIDQPKVHPTTNAMLPGPPITQPTAYQPGRPAGHNILPHGNAAVGNGAQINVTGGGTETVAAPGRNPRTGIVTVPNSSIVYDSQSGHYINKYPAASTQKPANVQPFPAPNSTGRVAPSQDASDNTFVQPDSVINTPRIAKPIPVNGPRATDQTGAPGNLTGQHGQPGPQVGVTPQAFSGNTGGSTGSAGKSNGPSGSSSIGSHFSSGGGGTGGSGGGGGSAHSGWGSGGGTGGGGGGGGGSHSGGGGGGGSSGGGSHH